MDPVILLETLMLIIFGCSWPVNIHKSVKSRTTLGKSLLYEVLIGVGYVLGIIAKIVIYGRSGEIQFSLWFYILDLCLVITDIILYFRNYAIDKKEGRIK